MANPNRVLIVGRSPSVLNEAVELVRRKGHEADATNQFDTLLDDYDVDELGVLVFGGMVPPDTKRRLRDEIESRNPGVVFVQGLAGIPGVIAAQVDGTILGALDEKDVSYDSATRTIRVDLAEPCHVSIDFLWGTSWTPPEPTSTSATFIDGDLPTGPHRFHLPDEIPSEASFAAVSINDRTSVLTIGPMPPAVTRMAPKSSADQRLPDVAAVTTRSDEDE